MTRFGEGDLTFLAEWYTSDVGWADPAPAPVTFARPGVPVATTPTVVYIAARLGTERRASSFSYELAPGTPPVPLATLMGSTLEGETGATALADVRVEVIGTQGGRVVTTSSGAGGVYFLPHVRVGVPLRLRASKPGFRTTEVNHPGIRAHPDGFPDYTTNGQIFRLVRED
ncbi:MAG: carboxypeptidase-like regulatory domain-containing protein [Vicinamibacterales bacterium]